MSNPTGYDAYSPLEISERVEAMGVVKARLPLVKSATLAVLAGLFIGFGGALFTMVMTGADPGLGAARFLGGVAFSGVLAIAGRKRRFGELSLPKFAAWGAVGGLVVALIPAVLTALGLATPNISLWQITAGLAAPFMLGGAIAASG